MKRADLDAILLGLPPLRDFPVADIKASLLPGLTNYNYRIEVAGLDWVLRIPKPETSRFIDRQAEDYNQSLAADLDIAPRVTWRDPSGISLTPTLKPTRSLEPGDFNDDKLLNAIVRPIQRLHRSKIRFHGSVNLGLALQQYYRMLSDKDQALLRERMTAAQQCLRRLDNEDVVRVASHNDLVLGNILLDQERVWIIDWEFSAMASPYWDLASLCNAANLDRQQSQRLLQCYCAGGTPMEESILSDYRSLLQLLSDCWMAALVRH